MKISAAAPLGKDTEDAVRKRLNLDVKQAWGMSELSPLGTMNSDYNIKVSFTPLLNIHTLFIQSSILCLICDFLIDRIHWTIGFFNLR